MIHYFNKIKQNRSHTTWRLIVIFVADLHRQSISFQVVLATDGERSFLLYDYGSGVMRWGEDAKWDNHPILLGYSDGSVEGTRLNVSDIYRPDLGSNIGKAYQLSQI